MSNAGGNSRVEHFKQNMSRQLKHCFRLPGSDEGIKHSHSLQTHEEEGSDDGYDDEDSDNEDEEDDDKVPRCCNKSIDEVDSSFRTI